MSGFEQLDASDPPRIGRYHLLARLGAGGMGRVYLARSPGGRAVAVKVVRPELAGDPGFRARFAREVAAARRVNSFFTAGVVDSDTDGDPAWLATAYVPGLSLADALGRHGPWPRGSVSALGAALGEALEAIHAAGVVHRDLKPSNVLIAADGPRLIDFGISVAVESASALTQTGTVVGTPGFMAPEQVRGERVGPAADVFALGAVLAYAASGQGPFGSGPSHVVNFRAVYEAPRLDGLPAELRELVASCLAKEAADRPSVPVLMERLAGAAGAESASWQGIAEPAWLPAPLAETVRSRERRPLPAKPPTPPPPVTPPPPAGPAAAEAGPEPPAGPTSPPAGDPPDPRGAHPPTAPARPLAPPVAGLGAPPGPGRRRPALLVPLGAALLAALVGLVYFLLPTDGAGENDRAGGAGQAGGSGEKGDGGDASGGSQPADPDGRFVFGAAGPPVSLDPSLASDGESFRVGRQVFETLLTHEPGGTELVGGLAETWEANEAGTEWTFHLRDGVVFHDGTALTGEAVCRNFDHWYHWSGGYQDITLSYYWQSVFGGFAENEDTGVPNSDYRGCAAPDERTAVITVAGPTAALPGGFTLAAFGIHSPAALDLIASQQVTGSGADLTYPEYSQQPGLLAGTGPFYPTAWDHDAGEVVLERFDAYWGEPAGVRELVFRSIPDEEARRLALLAGDVHGYDLVAPDDARTLREDGFQLPTRDVFNIFYLGFTQGRNPALAEPAVRRAIAHALDREGLVEAELPAGSVAATQFVPETVDGYSPDVPTYGHDPATARALLAEAGQEDLTLEFCYPTEVSRPYMPDPEAIHQRLSADLEAVGIRVESVPLAWNPSYLETVLAGDCDLRLMGWTGDYNDGYHYLGPLFHGYSAEWGLRNEELFGLLDRAAAEPDPAARAGLAREINELVMELLPGVPISSSPPTVAFSPDVTPPTVSPLSQEHFAEVSLTREG